MVSTHVLLFLMPKALGCFKYKQVAGTLLGSSSDPCGAENDPPTHGTLTDRPFEALYSEYGVKRVKVQAVRVSSLRRS